MANGNYLDKDGLALLWERIQRLVYECGCRCAVTYRLESDGNTVTLVGSDGTRSAVVITATASCSENE